MNFKLKKSDLNFKVYTVESKPTAAGAENDIAIISSVPMTNWIMSPEKPSGMPRNDGDVWIQYSVTGETFNVLKQNTLMIATISAWQYVDGAWVDRKAVRCQGGVWVDWFVYLYKPGDECADVTGGWTASGYSKDGAAFNTNGVTKIQDSITTNGAPGLYGGCGTSKTVDVTKHTKLYVTGKKNGTGDAYAFLSNSKNLGKANAENAVVKLYFETTNKELVATFGEMDGEYYIGWLGDCVVTEVRLA